MTERQKMFREIAEAFLTPFGLKIFRDRELSDDGICCAIGQWRYNDPLLFIRVEGVIIAFRDDMGFDEYDYWLPLTEDCDLIRGDFCYLMSLLTDKEFEELGK